MPLNGDTSCMKRILSTEEDTIYCLENGFSVNEESILGNRKLHCELEVDNELKNRE